MKKRLLVLIALSVLLTGCANVLNISKEDNSEGNIEEIGTKFTYENATCRVDGAKVEFSKLNRGNEITIIDEDDEFYYFDNNGLILAIEKVYVRTDNDEQFEEYTGYTYQNADLFSDYAFENYVTSFDKNDEVRVIDEVFGRLIVEYNGQIGYMRSSEVSDEFLKTYYYRPAPKVEEPVYTPSYSGGGGGGGSSSGGGGGGGDTPTPVNPDPPAPPAPSGYDDNFFEYADDVNVHLLGFEVTDNITEFVPNDSFEKVQGKVLLDGTVTYITLCNRNENVKVLEYDENTAKILIQGYAGTIEREYIRLENDEAYEEWLGYSYAGRVVFNDFNLEDVRTYLSKNDEVTVVDEIDGVYVVRLEDGTYGYMEVGDLSDTVIPTYHYVAPKVEEPVYTPSYDGGGGGGGSSSGGGGGGGDPTPPSPPSPPADSGFTNDYL